MLEFKNTLLSNFFNTLLQKGVEISLKYNSELHSTYIDLNIQSKSWLHFYLNDDNTITLRMRYDKEEILDLSNYGDNLDSFITDIAFLVKSCFYSNIYASNAWMEILCQYGVVKKKIETKVYYI